MFVRNCVLAALIVLALGCGKKDAVVSGGVMPVSAAAFDADVLKSTAPILVDFWAPWCGPCRMQAPVIEKLSQDDAYKGKVKFIKFNVDDDNKIPSSYGITGIPTLIIFRNGKPVETMVGLRTEDQLRAALNKVL